MTRPIHRLLLPQAPGAVRYALTATMLVALQHGLVALAFHAHGTRLTADAHYWLFPIRQLALLPDISPFAAIGGFAFCLLVSAALVALSLRRAAHLGRGGGLALATMVPTVQIAAALALTILPRRAAAAAPESAEAPVPPYQMALGILSGMALIVFAVALSGATFGAYGWGLFVMTPFLVGLTTGYIVNRGAARSSRQTFAAVAAAAALGTAALLMLALEGLWCILLVAPLAALLAGIGGAIGRAAARAIHQPHRPLYSVAVLPLIFLADAAMPPERTIATQDSVIVSASPDAVWQSLIANRPIREAPGLVGLAGLAYPVASRISGEGPGAHRHGVFSTGIAEERVTIWKPGRTLAFRVVRQPPAMEEMSPYRKLHTPHLIGYFDTGETRFDIIPLADGRTRLIARADHVLRIDPTPYWEPIARWAIRQNVARVLADARRDAEDRAKMGRHTAAFAAQSPHGHRDTRLAGRGRNPS